MIDIFDASEDEVGQFQSKHLHEKILTNSIAKPWKIRSNAPRHCRRTDDHNRRAADVFLQEFRPQARRPGNDQNTLENQPDYIQDLAIALHQYGTVDPETQRPMMEILTWYLNGQHQRQCHRPRRVLLQDDFLEWNDDFLVAWRDLLNPHQAIYYYVVLPEAPISSWEEHVAQLLIVQQPVHFERATLYSTVYYSSQNVAIQRLAVFSQTPVHREYCLDKAQVPRSVRHRPIQVFYGWQPIGPPPQPPLAIPDGASIVVHVRPLADAPSDQPDHQVLGALWDEFAFMARQPRADDSAIGADPDPDASSPSSPTGSSYRSDVQSHFFHIFQLRAPLKTCRIRTDNWANMHSGIRYALHLDRHDIQALHMVQHRPQDLRDAQTLVVIVQKPDDLSVGDPRRLVLIDIIFHAHQRRDFSVHRYALPLSEQTTRRQLLEELGLQPYCHTVRQRCFVKINDQLISLANHAPLHLHHGDYLRVDLPPHPQLAIPTRAIARCLRDGYHISQVQQVFDLAESDFEWSTVEVQPDGVFEDTALFQQHWQVLRRQTAETVAHAQRPEDPVPIKLADHLPSPNQVAIDFAAVQWQALALTSIPLGLLESLPSDLTLLDVTTDYLATLTHSLDETPICLHFYVDGSKIGSHVGAGIACFVDHAHGTFFAGCMSKAVPEADQAFFGEHAAMVWSLLWAIQVSDWFYATVGHFELDFVFHFDAMNTGYQTAGVWRTAAHKSRKTLMRSLAQVLQRRHHPARIRWEHVKAHSQQPCNELVDQLAKYAAMHPTFVEDCSAWIHWLEDPDVLLHIQWIWYWEHLQTHATDAPTLHGTLATSTMPWIQSSLVAPKMSGPLPVHQEAEVDSNLQDYHFDFTIATVNVLTLSSEDRSGRLTPTKQLLLQEQFHAAGCLVIGLQETRHRRIICPHNEHYHLIGHAADPQGHDGVQLWFSKRLPLFPGGPLIQLKNLTIIASGPTYLVVKLQTAKWRSIFITGRAPHAGRAPADNYQFWHQLSAIVRPYCRDFPLFFLGDTNGHVGHQPSSSIGPLCGSHENVPGTNFHNWLLEFDLKAVNTFEEHHIGGRHNTFVAPDGHHEARLDFIATPCALTFASLTSWVDDAFDLGGLRPDHYPVFCRLRVDRRLPSERVPYKHPRRQLNRFALAAYFQDYQNVIHFYDQLSTSEWTLDPHRTAHNLAQQTHAALHQVAQGHNFWRRKHHLSEEIWTLVNEKKSLFQQLKSLKATSRHTFLSAIFKAWRHGRFDCDMVSPWIRLHDHAVATTMSRLRWKSNQTTRAIRAADAAYYQTLAEDAGHAYTHEGLTAIWRKIKAVLPKNRLKQLSAKPDFGDSLVHHFADLEAGTVMSDDQARQQCLDGNVRQMASLPSIGLMDLSELPTLTEIEDLCLKQRPHRAAGLDSIPPEVCRGAAIAIAPFLHNLLMKSFLCGTEPYDYKGGQLCSIWKQKSSPNLATSYRGILLANVYGKVVHAWARSRLLPALLHRRAPGQIGGLPSQQTSTAVQLLRLHGRQGRARRLSTAVIFVDLRSAFHHLLREYVFSIRDPLCQTTLERFLNDKDFDLPRLAADLRDAATATPADVPPGLRAFLADIHVSTWFKMAPEDTSRVVTERGTRPESPLADLGFNLLMSRLMHIIGERLAEVPEYVQGCAALGVTVPPLSWVDDLAIPLTTTRPELLVSLIQATVEILHTTVNSHGMTMNCDGGKSEIVLMYRGPGANSCRSAMFDRDQVPVIVTAAESHILTLRVVATYRHLGARFTMDADIDLEIDSRIAMARQAFQQMKRPIFHNRYIPLPGRVRLHGSLVISRLLYGCAVWADVTSPSLTRLEAVLSDHYRSMANIGYWNDSHMTDEEVRFHLDVPSFRIIWARHRLIYLYHLALHGADYHHRLLLLEFSQGRGWLLEVQAELAWMANLVDLPMPVPETADDWMPFLECLRNTPRWKSLEFTQNGFDLYSGSDPQQSPSCPQHVCPDCEMAFPTKQTLAAHAYQVHGHSSVERQYVQSTVCPGCLRDHHTTWRLQQHLRYRQNGCFDRIDGARSPDQPVTITLPAHLKHIKRLPAVRRHHGPLRPTSGQRYRLSLTQRITQLRSDGIEVYAWWHPEQDPDLVQRAFHALRRGLATWCALTSPTELDFHNTMFSILFDLAIPDLLAGRIFVHWIENDFHDHWPEDLHPDLVDTLERAHLSMLEDIPAWEFRQQMKLLTDLWIHRPPDFPDFPARAAPLQPRVSTRCHFILSRFARLGECEQARAHLRFLTRPRSRTPSTSGPYYVVHLYSGRRRSHDFHEEMQTALSSFPNLDVRVISLDTAVDSSLNIHEEQLWAFLLQVAKEGRVLGLLQGPPCETWTSARHHQQVDADGHEIRGPRPLRSALDLWGLGRLTVSELAQIFTGNVLLLKGLLLAILVTLHGGATFLEHPATPYDESYASIWRLGLTRLLTRFPHGPFQRISIEQWRFGSEGIKPTTLMFSNSDLRAALDLCQNRAALRPTEYLIGKSADGTFRTSKAKEYPMLLNRAFAVSIQRAIAGWHLQCAPSGKESYGLKLAELSSCAEHGLIKPDYQPS
eukprot:s985_g2.t1